jgi:uncharacterized membrane protein YecN with MAPEG domain
MTGIPITLASAGLLGLMFIVLSANVVRQRVVCQVAFGDGAGKPEAKPLRLAIRMHGNFAEYVPLALLLLGGIEAAGAPHALVLGLAATLILARVLHPIGLPMKAPNPARFLGTILTWTVILVSSATALVLVL